MPLRLWRMDAPLYLGGLGAARVLSPDRDSPLLKAAFEHLGEQRAMPGNTTNGGHRAAGGVGRAAASGDLRRSFVALWRGEKAPCLD